MVEEARLESVYTPKAYPGFESPPLRRIENGTRSNNNKLILKIRHTMKKLFAIVAVIGAFTFGSIQLAQAQDAPAAEQTEQQAVAPAAETTAVAPVAEEGGIHK